jgi:hypothetical protein
VKFLVINRPNGRETKFDSSPAGIRYARDLVDQTIAEGTVEVAYAFVGGGHAYVVSARDTEQLFRLVRDNPLFKSSHTEVIPILDAVDALELAAKQAEKK